MMEASTGKKVGAAIGVLLAGVVVVILVQLFMGPRPPIATVNEEDARKVARVDTVMAGLKSAITVFVIVLAIFLAMGVSGVDTKALLVSAGVVGLVVGFGAQSIIRSFIAGLTMLSSNRLNIGDLVKLDVLGASGTTEAGHWLGGSGLPASTIDTGSAAGGRPSGSAFGIVRHFSLLTTTLEDVRGAKTYVSNGNIVLVTNYSQNPQRATVMIAVSHKQAPEAVRRSLEAFVESMALDAELKDRLIRPPSVKGVTAIGERTYVLTVTALSAPAATPFVERHMRQRLLQFLHEASVRTDGAVVAGRESS